VRRIKPRRRKTRRNRRKSYPIFAIRSALGFISFQIYTAVPIHAYFMELKYISVSIPPFMVFPEAIPES
jgi:hypothetical protein